MDINEFVDKVTDVGRDVANAVVDTTNEVVSKGKRQVESSKLRTKLRNCYRELGELAYNVEKGYGDDASKAELVEKIDRLQEQLETLESEREMEKQQREANRAEAQQAREAQRAQRKAATEPYEVRFDREQCANCGQERIGTLPFCGSCGQKFPE